ncbi:CRISPR-associated endonuclease Cas6 [Flavobacterium sp. CS20]|uniref:CRISPR-associated endonuclease Cas6 n=1 Tax=Flavobacterium sp. CS20 TaxID=2775246 RepID=UPI001B3A0706|nr:CRISPR-associated endonuclease Cas6 [Flavobacterium sp. CS20]QTY26837.1 DNA repair protein [Flavobacterium sp. CS20]
MSEVSTQNIQICKVQFPEIELRTRDAHKLRGYFGLLFKEHSPLLSNHYEDGSLRYRYPLVQYKVIDKTPILVGINEGGELLTQLFLKINQLDIDGKNYVIHSKNISNQAYEVGFTKDLNEYKFKTLWLALNQNNHQKYIAFKTETEKEDMLKRIVIGHVLSLFRNIGVELKPNERLMTKLDVKQKQTKFKDKSMLAFTGSFILNALLPDDIGLGKSVSRGFGTIQKQ